MSTDGNRVSTRNELRLDTIVSTEPELGPSIPDGGYGWIVFIASLFFHCLIPSLSVGFGILMVFSRLENSAPAYPTLWDNKLIFLPMFFTASWNIAEPWSRNLITQSTWPRLVGTAGTCLICAGLLVTWMGINNGYNVAVFTISGIITGIGSSIIMTQIEILISQYFRLKIRVINTLLYAANAIGFIGTPIFLGRNIVKTGMLHVLLWYQAIILQGIVICIAFRKPSYLKSKRKSYKIINNVSDDEEDVFPKNQTELQTKRETQKSSPQNSNKQLPQTSEEAGQSNTSGINENQERNTRSLMEELSVRQANWEKFDNESRNPSKVQIDLHHTFASDFSEDLQKIGNNINGSNNVNEIPQPLFADNYINNNVSYGFDSYEDIVRQNENPVVFGSINEEPRRKCTINMEDFKQPTFYKSLLQIITTRFSVFIFWSLFPSYLYNRVDNLKVHETTSIVGSIGVGVLLFSMISMWINVNSKQKAVYLWVFCWAGAVGYFTMSDAKAESTLLFGAVHIALSISALQVLGFPLLKINVLGSSSRTHILLNTITGLAFSIFFVIDFSYKNCFRLMALLQFLTGSVWFSNFIYKKIKKWSRQNQTN